MVCNYSQVIDNLFSVPCGELKSYVSPENILEEYQAARLVRHISEALEYLHKRDIILVNISVRSAPYC